MELWANTFGLSKPLKKDFDGTLERLKDGGVTGIEPCVVFSSAYGRMRNAFYRFGFSVGGLIGGNWFGKDAYNLTERALGGGLTVGSAHCALANASPEILGRLIEPAAAYAQAFGLRYLAVSLAADSVRSVLPFAQSLKRFAEVCAARGVTLLYHNHACEIANLGVLDALLQTSPLIGLELDVGWAVWAGRDPSRLIEAYADRIKILHLKDVRVGQKGSRKFAAVGEGDLPLAETLRAVANIGAMPLVIDQDDGADIMSDVRRGAENVKRLSL